MLDRPQLVVVDTTPIISLALLQHLHLLKILYTEVLIPLAVQAEVIAGGSRTGAAELRRATYIRSVPLQDPQRATLLSDLDRGEAEVIALGIERHANLLIIDEQLGRRHAQRLGLPITGTLGVLLKAKQLGYVPEIKPLILQLRQNGIRLGDALTKHMLELADERS